MLAACGTEESKPKSLLDPLGCFPKDAQRWIARSSDGQAQATAKLARKGSGKATVYVDRSGSMVGYIAGANNFERPFQDLVATMPASLKLAGLETAFRSFGTTISDPLPNAGAELQKGDAFTCKAGGAPCDNSESRLDVVLSQVKDSKDDLSIVVSDLWFTNSEIQSTGIAALQPMLTELLFSDRVIAIYGLSAPFNGKIYDLPKAGTGSLSVPYSGRHPLYVMVIGSKQSVLDFDTSLASSGSRYLAEGIRNGTITRSLFAVDPGPVALKPTDPLSASKHPKLRRDNFAIPQGVAIQRFAMQRGLPERPGAGAPPLPQWTGPDPASFLANAVWAGPTTAQTRIWVRSSEACAASSWTEQKPSEVGWGPLLPDGRRTFSLDPAKFGASLLNEGTYLIVGETRRLSVAQPNPATAWMRGEWNLDPVRAESAAQSRPALFPTLNLSEFGRIMEAALAAAAERKNQPVNGFAVMVKVSD